MVAMTAVHFSFKSPCLKCLSRTLKRKPSVEVSSPRSSKETGKCLTKSGSACSPLMYLKLQWNKTLTRKIPPKFDALFWFFQRSYFELVQGAHCIFHQFYLLWYHPEFISNRCGATISSSKKKDENIELVNATVIDYKLENFCWAYGIRFVDVCWNSCCVLF